MQQVLCGRGVTQIFQRSHLLLLHLKEVTVEVPLERFVRVVDEELLESVRVEVLETVDIEDADEAVDVVGAVDAVDGGRGVGGRGGGGGGDGAVELLHQPEEEALVDELRQGVPLVDGLGDGLGLVDSGVVHNDLKDEPRSGATS